MGLIIIHFQVITSFLDLNILKKNLMKFSAVQLHGLTLFKF